MINNKINEHIRKDDFKRYKLDCAKLALLYANKENLNNFKKLSEAKKISYFFHLDEINVLKLEDPEEHKEFKGKTIEDGIAIGENAKSYFKLKTKKWKDLDIYAKKIGINKTKEFMNNDKYDVLFEPIFVYENTTTKCDVLRRFLDGWELIEVKAVNKLKKEHLFDVIFQYYVLTKLGIKINSIKLMHLNKEYILDDLNDLDLNYLFILESNFKYLRKEDTLLSFAKDYIKNNIENDLQNLTSIMMNKNLDLEKFFLSDKCFNGSNEYCHHIIKKIPDKDTIFNLYRLNFKKKAKFLFENNLIFLKDINLANKYFHIFNENQIKQISIVQGTENIINKNDKNMILKVLSEYKYPVFMYDFETFQSAIPKFIFTKPYQQIPFQYSLHILNDKNFDYETGKNIDHFYFLSDGDSDPRISLINKMVSDFFVKQNAVYVAYNKSFEIGRINELVEFINYDLSKNKNLFQNHNILIKKLKYIKNNTIDLLDFFHLHGHFLIYKKEFNGSLSIKSTLPAFDSTFNYKHLKVQKGDIASETFRRRIENNITLDNWNKNYRNEMINYCNQDTLGMVVLFEKIIKLISKEIK